MNERPKPEIGSGRQPLEKSVLEVVNWIEPFEATFALVYGTP
jgi:hypothetical protein